VPAIADAATAVVRMVNATHVFEVDALALLIAAQDAVAQADARGPLTAACGLAAVGPDHPLHGLARATAAVDVLIRAPDFAEGAGHEALLPLPSRSIRHYVASEPAGCWALNLVLVARGIVPPVTGLVPRTIFRLDLADAERAAALVDHSNREALAAFTNFERMESALGRGRDALVGLSRAGADIQARALAAAGLVMLETGGLVTPALPGSPPSSPATLDHGPLCAAAADLDLSLAEIDRILSRRRD
jgi:hypothetical protein